ncbi:MAG: DUF4124 domain-containing protein [Lysobacteraceae bacterium]|nr:MAG: DUF4124 domain-containing protein [Xanthomonadaceae bacterium]
MPRSVLLIVLVLASLYMVPGASDAQVRRCNAADGTLVFTDRKCSDIGASERIPPVVAAGVGGSLQLFGRAPCARTLQDLSYALGSAIQSGDANQVSGLYDWAGMSTANAYRVMDRLEAIARRPLVDVQPIQAGGGDSGEDMIRFDDEGHVVPPAPRRSRTVGLRVEQTLANGSTPSHVTFGLRQRMGCWWVSL